MRRPTRLPRLSSARATLPTTAMILKRGATEAMSKLQDLIDLAKEPSSEKRRVLLREITDLFFVNPDHQPAEMGLFDDVLSQLAGEMEAAVRAELSGRMAPVAHAPAKLVRGLATDASIEVARPILEGSAALSEADLLAISRRERVPEAVSEVIVKRGDDATLGVLLGNDGAMLSRQAHEAAVD